MGFVESMLSFEREKNVFHVCVCGMRLLSLENALKKFSLLTSSKPFKEQIFFHLNARNTLHSLDLNKIEIEIEIITSMVIMQSAMHFEENGELWHRQNM